MTVGRPLVATVLATALTIGVTWPLFAGPTDRVLAAESLYGPAASLVQRDVNLTLWTLAWDCHALATDPARLFHANTFHPAPLSLAFSEHMLGNVPLFCPVYAATGNPVLAHQVALLATFVVATLAMQAFVAHWTRDAAAALAAGLLFAFAPFRLWHVGNLHVVSIHWLPLVPLGIDLVLDGRRGLGGVLLALGLVASTACSYYVGYAAFVLAAAYGVGRAPWRSTWPALATLAGAGASALVLIGAMTIPYLVLQQRGVIPPQGHQSESATWGLIGTLREGPLGMARFFLWPRKDGPALFLTFGTMAAAVAGGVVWRRAPRGALVATALVGFVLVLGPALRLPDGSTVALPYRWLASIVPGFSVMRVPQRLGAITMLAVVALAGLGLAGTRRLLHDRGRLRLAAAVPILLVAVTLVEGRRRGLRTLAMPVGATMPAAHRWLAAHGEGGPMMELPIRRHQMYEQSLAVYRSTAHWLPIANGYAPYVPESFTRIMDAAERLPDPAALEDMLAAAPFRWLVVARSAVRGGAWPAWRSTFAARGIPVAADFGDVVVYEVPPAPR